MARISKELSIFLVVFVGLARGYAFSSFSIPGLHAEYLDLARGIQEPNEINRPIVYPHLGVSPDSHNIVYKYITDFAGTDRPPHAKVADYYHSGNAEESDSLQNKDSSEEGSSEFEKPGSDEPGVASDFILLRKEPNRKNFESIKLKVSDFGANPQTNPPIGGVMSNYVLLRSRPDFKNFIPFSSIRDVGQQISKRQTDDLTDTEDTVVINAENPHSVKMNEEADDPNANDGEDGEEDQPAIAQSKPAAIALAGPGGVAQASPVGTALVGPGGLAVAAPSGTAVAGPAGQGAIIAPSDDKAKLVHKKIKEAWN